MKSRCLTTATRAGILGVALLGLQLSGISSDAFAKAGQSSNKPPVADFSDSISGMLVNFKSTSTDSDGKIAKVSWNFGDNSTATGQTPRHVYQEPGTYAVSLTVDDNDGARNTKTRKVTVAVDKNNKSPVASFSDSVNGMTVSFNNTSTDSDGKIEGVSWHFGDSATAVGWSPKHTYSKAGTYTVSLGVYDNDGATSTAVQTVEVGGSDNPPPSSSGGSNPPPSSAPPPPAIGQDDGSKPPQGVSPGPADPRGKLSSDCASLKTCTLSVAHEGPYTDPVIAGIGWSSAEYARLGDGKNCILFLLGQTGTGNQDNSVRCLDPATGKFSIAVPDTENAKQEVNGNGLNVRDNMMMLNVPNFGLLVYGGAYWASQKASHWDGFLDYNAKKWTYIDNVYGLFEPQKSFFSYDDKNESWLADWSKMNPAVAWSEQLNEGFIYGGDNAGGSPGSYVTLVHPRKDGHFDLESLDPPPSGTRACTFIRNSAVAVGDWAYVVGGRCASDATHSGTYDSAAFRRFNLVTHQWQMLDPLPDNDNLRMPVVTYDSHSGYIVVYGGNGGHGMNQGDPGYWVGRNAVYIWNVATQGPWLDITKLANMPAMFQASGAYDPTSGWHCYRPGRLFDANGVEVSSTTKRSQVYCMQLNFVPKK